MEKLIVNRLEMKLVSINYKVGKSTGSEISVEDNYVVENIDKDSLRLLFERSVTLDFERKENLKIKVSIVRFGADGVDLTKELTEDLIRENINHLLGPALSFMPTLVAQITGSFGDLPFVTAPSFYDDDEKYNDGDDEE